MRIEFYHIDAMEVPNYVPIWRELRQLGVDAQLVTVPDPDNTASAGWFDFDTTATIYREMGIPFTTVPDYNCDLAITTQYPHILRPYRGLKIRLMYGLHMLSDSFFHSEKASRDFDAVLVHGPYSKKLVSRWKPEEDVLIVGYPKYDDFFSGRYHRSEISRKLGLDETRSSVVYLPTWDEASSLDTFLDAVAQLNREYNVIIKPHHCTARMEPERMNRIMASGAKVVVDSTESAALCVVSDLVLADIRSGSFYETVAFDIPVVGLTADPEDIERHLDKRALTAGPLCTRPGDLQRLVSIMLSSEQYADARRSLADDLVSFRDGTAAKHAADEIIRFVGRKCTSGKERSSKISVPVQVQKKVENFKRKERNIFWICLDGLRVDKLFCCGNTKRPKLFLDEVLSKGILFTKVFSAAAGTHTVMHAIFTSMYPVSNGVKGWTSEAIRRIDPHVLSLTDFLKRAGYQTFRYCDLDGEQVVPKSGFDVWEFSGYPRKKAFQLTGGTLDCPKRDEFIRQYNQSQGPKFAYIHLFLLHELNCKLGKSWPSEKYENNITKISQSLESLLQKIEIDEDDLLIISTDHGVILDKPYVEYERTVGPRHEEISNLTFCSFITKDITPCHINKLVSAIDIAPTILDIISAGPMGAQGRSLLPLMLGGIYEPVMVFREKGAAYDIPPSPNESNLWCVRTEKWKYVTHKWRKDCEWLIDLGNDPDYTNNLIGKGLEIEKTLRDAVYKTLIDNPKKPLEIYAENNLDFSRRDIKPVTSVIIPVVRATPHLKDSIESLLAQIGPYFELIIVDGEETEDTGQKILELYGDYPHVHYHRLKQHLLHELLNFGIQQAGGSYIAMALPEVVYEENFLYELKKELDRNPEIGLAYSNYEVVDEVGNVIRCGIASEFDSEALNVRNCVGVCILFRSSLLEKSGLFTNERYLCWDMWKRMAKTTDVGNVPQTLAKCYGVEDRVVGGRAPSFQPCRVPKVSVVLPTYNHFKFLPQAVESILSQTFTDFELIVVNDGSTDGTREYLDGLKDPRIRVIHQENKHLPEALNIGFRTAHGELLTWISSDNYCAPMFLEAFVSAMDANPNAGLAYSAFAHIDERGQIIRIIRYPDMDYKQLLAEFPGMASFMYRRSCREKVGLYNPELEGAEDWDMWLRIGEHFPIVYVPDMLVYYRWHDDSMTKKVPEKVFQASLQTFNNAISRVRLEHLYPSLKRCKDQATAQFHAFFDFGTALMQSKFGVKSGAACKFLEKARSLQPNSIGIISNLAVAYGQSGQWKKVVPLMKMLQGASSPKALNICHSIIEAYRTGKPNLLSKISLFTLDKKSIELFQLEQRQKRIFSLAHCNQDSPAKKISENEFAALNKAKGIGRQGEDSSEKSKGRIIEENKRKILLVVHSFPPDWYAGVENYTCGFAKMLIAKGFDVSVFYPKSDPHIQLPILKEDSYNGIKIYKLLSKSFYNFAFHVENNKVEKLFGNLLDEQCFNLIHCQHIKGFPFSLLNIAKDKGIPVCLTLHDFWFICHKTHLYLDGTGELCTGPDSVDKCAKCALSNVQNTADPRQTTFLHHMIAHRQEYVRKLLRKIDIVAAPSRYLKEKFISCRFGKDKIAICPLGIEPVAAGERKRTDGVTFGFLGAIHELKNTVFLAEVFKRIRGNTKLIFWGDGKPGEIAKLQSVIEGQSHIEYKGAYSPEQLPEILSGIDIVIVPSLVENYPLVVRESLSAGVPVIASNVGGIPEIVSHMKNGMLFEPNNKEELAKRIQEIVDNPSIIEQLKKGITHIRTIKEDVEEWIDRYSKLIGGRDKRAGCSIIIPVFNKLELTRECMESIYSNTKYANYEIIIVDNGSNDGTKEHLQDISKSYNNIKVIINEENLGFARACNQGAAASSGDYLVFLNNDTQVQSGWLEEFVKVLENDSEAGAVGSKLLYPDGSVQHAGVVILEIEGVNPLLPKHIFVQQPSDNNFVNVPMVFQAVTAACVAVRKSDFENVNGFDESYWNGSEDVDLCFKLMEMGKKIVYQPKSVVTHYESKSGKERRKGIKQNNKLLRQRWADKIKPDIIISGNQLREGTSQAIQPYLKSGEFVSVSRFQYINALIPWVKKFFVDGNRLPVKKLTFAIKTCTPSREKKRWGDTYFANSLAKAFMKLGYNCEVHFRDEWNQPDTDVDIVIHIKGLFRYKPKPYNFNILWIISHPELHTTEEINQFDVVFCASKIYAENLKNTVKIPCFYLPQATDKDFFKPLNNKLPKDIDVLFVGTNYYPKKRRKIIQDVLDTGKKYNLYVVGNSWHGLLDKQYYKAEHVEWHKLPELYSRAKIVLNDHHETMKQFGFINNRTFDLAALKVFQISDHVKGIEELKIVTYQTPEDLREKLDYFLQNENERQRIANINNQLCKNFTFINIAREIFSAVNKLSYQKNMAKTKANEIKSSKQNLFADISRQAVNDRLPRKGRLADAVYAASTSHLYPRVSIVISCYNCENFLLECLDSIRNQTMNDWELFLLDDASTDGTRSIIEKYAQIDERIKPYYFRDNRGPYVRRNFAIERANSDFIVIQDADDIMYPPKLEILYNEIAKDERLGVVGSFYQMFLDEFKGLEYTDRIELPIMHDEIMGRYCSTRYVCWHGSAIIRKTMFEAIGLYDEHPYGSDRLWLAKMAEYARWSNDVRLKNVPEYLTLKREHPLSQQGLLPTLDPRSRRTRFQVYWEYKLVKIREKLQKEPATDLAAELRSCDCSDYIERFGYMFEQWESEPLDDEHLHGFISKGIREFYTAKYVSCIITLNSVERMVSDVAKEFWNYDLLWGLANFALDRKEQCEFHIKREIKQHQNSKAEQFLNKYLNETDGANELTAGKREVIIERVILGSDDKKLCVAGEADDTIVRRTYNLREAAQPRLSIVIVASENKMELLETLDALNNQSDSRFETIVINNVPGAFEAQHVADKPAYGLSVIELAQKTSTILAKNIAISHAQGDYVAFLAEDAVPNRDFVRNIINHFENSNVSGLRGKILPKSGSYKPEYYVPGEKAVCTGCDANEICAFRRDILVEVGGFKEKLYGNESIELSYRIYRACQKDIESVMYFPDVIVYHGHYTSEQEYNNRMFIEEKLRYQRFKEMAEQTCPEMLAYLDFSQRLYPSKMRKHENHYYWLVNNSLLLQKRCPEEAVVWAEKAVSLEPEVVEGRYMLGLVYVSLGKYSEAQQQLEPILAPLIQMLECRQTTAHGSYLKPAVCYVDTCTKLAQCYMKQGKYDKQKQIFTHLLNNPHIKLPEQQRAGICALLAKLEKSRPPAPVSKPALSSPTIGTAQQPLVSVIIPAYNAERYVAETIKSVLNQNYKNFELVVVNDGSIDQTKDIVLSFQDERIKYLYQENRGLASAHNVGIKNSKGNFLIKLDSDDMMTPDFIVRHLVEFRGHPEADLIYCDDYLIDENDKPIRVIERPEYTYRELLIRDLFRCGFPLVPFRTCIRRSVFDKIGLFDEGLLVGEDYDMMRRFVKQGLKAHHLKGALYLRRMHTDSLSRSYSAQKAKSHFEVIKRFIDTFAYDELFPDVEWDKIPTEMRQLHAKCLAAVTYLAIGQTYVKTNLPIYAKMAFGLAGSELNDCLKMDPENQRIRQLLQKCEFGRQKYDEQILQAVR